MDNLESIALGTIIGFALLAGFGLMLYVAFKAIWIAGRMAAGAHRSAKRFQHEQIILSRDLVAHRETNRHN